MKKYLLLLGIIVGGITYSNAQDFGYLGKKNLISVFGTGNFRVLAGVEEPIGLLDENGYRTVTYKNSSRKEGFKLVRFDTRFAYTRLLSRGFGIGAEFGYEKYKMTSTSFSLPYSSPVYNVYSTMLTFSFFGRNTIAPTGFSTTIGIGPKMYSFNRGQDYMQDSLGITVPITNPYPEYKRDLVGLNIFLELGKRIPVAEFMTIDVAMRVNTGYVFYGSVETKDGSVGSSNDSFWRKSDLHSQVMRENLGTLITFKLGLSFML